MQCIAALDAAMQVFVEVWEDPTTTRDQVVAAYGGAAFFLGFFTQVGISAPKAVEQARKLLNDAAGQLNFPATY